MNRPAGAEKLLLGLMLVAGLSCAPTARAGEPDVNVIRQSSTQPYPGITITDESDTKPPLHVHVVTVDLSDPHVHVVTPRPPQPDDPSGQWELMLQTVSLTAAKEGLVVAVNGDFFMPKSAIQVLGRKDPYFPGNWANVCGIAMSDGQCWSQRAAAVSLAVDDAGHITIGPIQRVPKNAKQIVSSIAQIVTNGRNTAVADPPAPRTAVGIDKAGKTLYLLVADGRRPDYSVGLTLSELADRMLKLGCNDAMNLDGGGSSTMVLRDPVSGQMTLVNRPSDGHDLLIPLSIERPVANVLGIRVDGIGPSTVPATQNAKGTADGYR